jgi:hypothetical protein
MPQPPFQKLQDKVFDTVTKIMGYDASWTPVSGGSAHTARVNFRSPNLKELTSGFQFSPKMIMAEWKKGDFSGLEITFSNHNEHLVINSVTYNVINVKANFDGQTFEAVLEES